MAAVCVVLIIVLLVIWWRYGKSSAPTPDIESGKKKSPPEKREPRYMTSDGKTVPKEQVRS